MTEIRGKMKKGQKRPGPLVGYALLFRLAAASDGECLNAVVFRLQDFS